MLKLNKKEEVIKELGPIAKVLNIKIDYVIDSKREYLVCDNTKICTSCTSVYGISGKFDILKGYNGKCLCPKCIEKGPQENCSPLPRKNEKQLSIFDLEVMSRGN